MLSFQIMPLKLNISGYGLLYPERDTKRKSENYDRNNKLKEEGTQLSYRAKQKIRNLLTYLYLQNNQKLKFFTITIPPSKFKTDEIHNRSYELFEPDTFYIDKLGQLLHNLRKHHGLRNYFWIAERQLKNKRGALHFHCIFDADFISVQRIAHLWSNLLSDYHQSSKSCVDYKQIKNISELGGYIAGYISKNSTEFYKDSEGKWACKVHLIYGRVWGCSRDYSSLIRKSTFVTSEDIDLYLSLADSVREREIELGNFKMTYTALHYNQKNSSYKSFLQVAYDNFGFKYCPRVDIGEVRTPEFSDEQ